MSRSLSCFFFFTILLWANPSIANVQTDTTWSISIAQNGYTHPVMLNEDGEDASISTKGLEPWHNTKSVTKTYFVVNQLGRIQASLQLNEVKNNCMIRVGLAGSSQHYDIQLMPSQSNGIVLVGDFDIKKTGYHAFTIQGISQVANTFPGIAQIKVQGAKVMDIQFNRSNYKGAASTHLRYQVPGDSAVQWFYTEVKVPNSVANSVHAYYETNGFHSGYGGIQINSLNERRFIFSIWSKYKTDDPSQIPAEYAVNLNGKGPGVFTGEFGNEGSGGHSHLVYPWKTNTTYHFLTGITRIQGDSASYIGFYASPADGYQWHLLSKWTQHKTDTKTGFKNLYAFVENFGPNGDDFFKAYYGNQWAVTFNGNWLELTSAKFTTTANPLRHQRFDYGAGVEGKLFYMYSGGFNSIHTINAGDTITRPGGAQHPVIDFKKLLTL
jgi:hypothetical protein